MTAPIRTIEAPIGWVGRSGCSPTVVAPAGRGEALHAISVDHAADHGPEPEATPEGNEEAQTDG